MAYEGLAGGGVVGFKLWSWTRVVSIFEGMSWHSVTGSRQHQIRTASHLSHTFLLVSDLQLVRPHQDLPTPMRLLALGAKPWQADATWPTEELDI